MNLMEFGIPEAMWHLRVNNFAAIVTMDAHGNSLHADVEKATARRTGGLQPLTFEIVRSGVTLMVFRVNGILLNGQIAQLVERSPEKAGVGGSIPSLATTLTHLVSTLTDLFFRLCQICAMDCPDQSDLAGSDIPGSTWHSNGGLWRDCPRGCLQHPRWFRPSLESLMPAYGGNDADAPVSPRTA